MSIALPPQEYITATRKITLSGMLNHFYNRPQYLTFGQPAPSLNLLSVTNHKIYLKRYNRFVVVVNFCASWCVACQWQKKDWVDLQKKYAKDLVVINLFVGEARETISTFTPISLAQKSCPVDGNLLWEWGFYPSGAIPKIAVLDRFGIVVDTWTHYRTKNQIETALTPFSLRPLSQ